MTLWISPEFALAIHAEQLAQHGGGEGIRDQGLLESALSSPQNMKAYGDPDLAELAACYTYAIVNNHPFVDGNKRTGFVVGVTFLFLNDVEFEAAQAEVVQTILAVADGSMDMDKLAEFYRMHII